VVRCGGMFDPQGRTLAVFVVKQREVVLGRARAIEERLALSETGVSVG
jgi:hypothetical protein